jgi:hypothetical protein
MAQGSEIRIAVFDLPRQEIRVAVSGEGVLQLEENAHAFSGDREMVRPDIVQAFVDCASLGMFCGAENEPARSRARMLARQADIEKRDQTWRIELHAVDAGAFRILLNLLLAMDLDSVELASVTEPDVAGPRRIDPVTIRYPGVIEPLPFAVDYQPPERSNEPRAVQLIYTRELDTELVERACSALEHWSTLLMLGGYAPSDLEPRDSSVLPDVPFQYDAFTVEQSFEFFYSDETAFGAIVNWARRERGPSFPIERISIF